MKRRVRLLRLQKPGDCAAEPRRRYNSRSSTRAGGGVDEAQRRRLGGCPPPSFPAIRSR